jgi:hypothetical protein
MLMKMKMCVCRTHPHEESFPAFAELPKRPSGGFGGKNHTQALTLLADESGVILPDKTHKNRTRGNVCDLWGFYGKK